MSNSSVNQQILDHAEFLIQLRGYNHFSYRDLATHIGVKTSSIHYYYPTKTDLGVAVLHRHAEFLMDTLQKIANREKLSSLQRLEQFCDFIVDNTYEKDKRMCLGGMLASDVFSLPEKLQEEVRRFFIALERWLIEILEAGAKSNEYVLANSPKKTAKLIISLLEGALLLARLHQDTMSLNVLKQYLRQNFS